MSTHIMDQLLRQLRMKLVRQEASVVATQDAIKACEDVIKADLKK